MITGSGLKKSYIFRFCVFFRFFDAMILMFPIRFLFDFFWLRGFSPAFWLQLFRRFHFSVNNCILYANSTEISGFSVLLCFLRPSILPCWYCRHFTDEKEALVVSSNCFRRLGKPHDMHLETASMVVFSMKNAITIKWGRVQSKRNWWTPAARMSTRHDKYLLSFTNLLLQLLVVNNTSNANGLKVILHEKVQYNRLSRCSIGFFKYHQSITGFSTAMIVASHEFFLHIDVGLFENWFISQLIRPHRFIIFPTDSNISEQKRCLSGESWTAWRVEIPGADAQKSWDNYTHSQSNFCIGGNYGQ